VCAFKFSLIHCQPKIASFPDYTHVACITGVAKEGTVHNLNVNARWHQKTPNYKLCVLCN